MHSTFKKAISLLLALILVSALIIVATADEDKNESESYENESYESEDSYSDESASAQSGTSDDTTAAEPIYLADYFAGTQLDLEQYLGKVVIINYFTEWCPYCMEEMPDYKKVLDTYDPEQLVVLLVHPWDGEDESNSASVVETYGLEAATVIEDEDFALTSAIGVPGYPTTVIVDQNGYVSYAVASRIDFDTISSILDMLGVETAGKLPAIFAQSQPNIFVSHPASDATSSATP